jgi:hypothetical protein
MRTQNDAANKCQETIRISCCLFQVVRIENVQVEPTKLT